MVKLTLGSCLLLIVFVTGVFAQDETELDCSTLCAQDLPAVYSDQDREQITQCLNHDFEKMTGGPSLNELRVFFEITGKIFQKSSSDTKTPEMEKKLLLKTLYSGLSEYIWPIGATDCDTHARKLKSHFEKELGNQDFKFEIVSTYQDIDSDKFIDLKGSLSPMGNHYLIRAVSLASSRSYIIDGYTIPSVEHEPDLFRKTVVLNRYEECFFAPVMKAKLGLNPQEDILGMIASFTPAVKSSIARGAKAAASACAKGAKKVIIPKSLF